MTTGWIDRMRRADPLHVAGALGLTIRPARGASGGSIVGCPRCGADRRHPSRGDRRGALGVRADGRGFRCMQCDLSGDAITLVAWVEGGAEWARLSPTGKDKVRQWCEHYTGTESIAFDARDRAPAAPATYPPAAEVQALIEQCRQVDMDAGVAAYLRGRCIDPGAVADRQLAWALPVDAEPPAWATRRWDAAERRWLSWIDTSHRLIVPLYDAQGVLRSVLARSIDTAVALKSVAPTGFQRTGLVMACPFGRWLLANGTRPEWWPAEQELRVIVAEGEPDHLTIATTWSDAAEYAPATLGVVAGGWSAAIATRIPDHTTVDVATHADQAGDRYAEQVAASLAGRPIIVRRWKASQEASS